jgi:hypothetical protein
MKRHEERIRWVAPLRDDEIDRVARDGESISIPVLMCDSLAGYRRGYVSPAQLTGHQPGFVALSDAQIAERRRARDAWVRNLSDAWRGDARRKKPPDDDDENGGDDDDETNNEDRRSRSASDARAAATRSYDAMVRRLSNAWRGPGRDAAQPDLGSTAEELMRRGTEGRTDPNAATEIEQRLEIERAQRRRDLSSAWQQSNPTRSWERDPVGNPGASVAAQAEGLERDRQQIHAEFSERLSNAWKFRTQHV